MWVDQLKKKNYNCTAVRVYEEFTLPNGAIANERGQFCGWFISVSGRNQSATCCMAQVPGILSQESTQDHINGHSLMVANVT